MVPVGKQAAESPDRRRGGQLRHRQGSQQRDEGGLGVVSLLRGGAVGILSALGISQSDELSGALSLAFTILELNEEGFEARFDSRTPLCGTEETVNAVAEKALKNAGFTVEGKLDPPHHVPADSPFIQTLANAYETWTGEKSECLAIGGGTYVHDIPGGVAFGANMPGFACSLHGPDERVSVQDLMTTAEIYAQVILELCT